MSSNLTGRANYFNDLDQNNDLLIYQPGHTSGHKRQAGFLRPDKALARFSPRIPRLAATTTTAALSDISGLSRSTIHGLQILPAIGNVGNPYRGILPTNHFTHFGNLGKKSW